MPEGQRYLVISNVFFMSPKRVGHTWECEGYAEGKVGSLTVPAAHRRAQREAQHIVS